MKKKIEKKTHQEPIKYCVYWRKRWGEWTGNEHRERGMWREREQNKWGRSVENTSNNSHFYKRLHTALKHNYTSMRDFICNDGIAMHMPTMKNTRNIHRTSKWKINCNRVTFCWLDKDTVLVQVMTKVNFRSFIDTLPTMAGLFLLSLSVCLSTHA